MQLVAVNKNIVSIGGNLLAMDARKPFIIEVDTSKGNGFNTFTLPLTNHTTDIYVKVSDGQRFTINNYLDAKRIINFASAGVYTIELRGQCGWRFDNTGDCQKLIEIIQGGNLLFNAISRGFYGCINLISVPYDWVINAPYVTDMSYLFTNCSKLSSPIPPKIFYACPQTVTIYACFSRCSEMASIIPIDLLRYVTKVTNLAYFFEFCYKLNGNIPIDLLRYVTKVTNLYRFLIGCRNITGSIPNNLFAYMPDLTDVGYFFEGCSGISGKIPDDLLMYSLKIRSLINFLHNMKRLEVSGYFINPALIPLMRDWSGFMSCGAGNEFTGTMQPVWETASPTAIKVNAFLNQKQLTNYNDIPNEWKGL